MKIDIKGENVKSVRNVQHHQKAGRYIYKIKNLSLTLLLIIGTPLFGQGSFITIST